MFTLYCVVCIFGTLLSLERMFGERDGIALPQYDPPGSPDVDCPCESRNSGGLRVAPPCDELPI